MADPKLIPLKDWADRNFDPPPSAWVLRAMCRRGEIYPPPVRVGRDWRVRATARLVRDASPVGGGLVAQLTGA